MSIKQIANWSEDQIGTFNDLGINRDQAQLLLMWIVDGSYGFEDSNIGRFLPAFKALARVIPPNLRDNPGRVVYRGIGIHMKYAAEIRKGEPVKLPAQPLESWTSDVDLATKYAKSYLSNPAKVGVVLRSPVSKPPLVYLSDKVLKFLGQDSRTPRQNEAIFTGSLVKRIDGSSLERLYDGED